MVFDPNAPQIASPRPKRARITVQDATAVAKLVALRFSEKMACSKLDLNYRQWAKWKERANQKGDYDNLLTRMKADKCANMLESIESAATGANGIRLDWRAAREMLNLVDKNTYADMEGQQSGHTSPTITLDRMKEIMQIMAPQAQLGAPVIDCEPVKSLPPEFEPDDCAH